MSSCKSPFDENCLSVVSLSPVKGNVWRDSWRKSTWRRVWTLVWVFGGLLESDAPAANGQTASSTNYETNRRGWPRNFKAQGHIWQVSRPVKSHQKVRRRQKKVWPGRSLQRQLSPGFQIISQPTFALCWVRQQDFIQTKHWKLESFVNQTVTGNGWIFDGWLKAFAGFTSPDRSEHADSRTDRRFHREFRDSHHGRSAGDTRRNHREFMDAEDTDGAPPVRERRTGNHQAPVQMRNGEVSNRGAHNRYMEDDFHDDFNRSPPGAPRNGYPSRNPNNNYSQRNRW